MNEIPNYSAESQLTKLKRTNINKMQKPDLKTSRTKDGVILASQK